MGDEVLGLANTGDYVCCVVAGCTSIWCVAAGARAQLRLHFKLYIHRGERIETFC